MAIGTLRDAFDRENNFETVRLVKLNGKVFGPGQPFDKTQVTTRRLRQLYDARYLRMVTASDRTKEPKAKMQVNLGNAVDPPKKLKRVRLQAAE